MSLKNIKITLKLGLAVSLTLLSIVIFSALVIYEKSQVLSDNEALTKVAKFSASISELVHELQKERGATSVFVGNHGKVFKKELVEQRVLTDEKVAFLNQNFQKVNLKKIYKNFHYKVSTAINMVKKLEAKREGIDQLLISGTSAFDFYTRLNGTLMDIMSELSITSSQVDVTHAVIPYVAFMQAKEQTGQQRAIGGNAITNKKFSKELYTQFVNTHAQEGAYLSTFETYAEPTQITLLHRMSQSIEAKEFHRMHRELLDWGVSTKKLKFSGSVWFEKATAYINLLRDVELQLASDLQTVTERKSYSAKQELVLTGIMLALFIGISIFLITVIRGITTPLLDLTSTVSKLAKGDIHVDIPSLNRGDELGKMAKSVKVFKDYAVERTEIIEGLEKATEKALEAVQTKSQFLAVMSHEIRTPMNGVLGCANLLLDSVKNPEDVKLLKTLLSSGESLLVLINDILDFSKIESGKMTLESLPLNINESIHDVIQLLNSKASEKGISLYYQIDNETPAWILGDITRLRQVLLNLVGNAIKFTKKGSVKVGVQARELENQKYEIKFYVKDSGIGIPQELQGKLFKSFSQADASTTRKFGGTGLGLAISKGLVEAMGGSIWVESLEGRGATFYFTLITEESEVKEKGQSLVLNIDPELGEKLPLKILLAEDNTVNQMVAKKLLSKIGYRIDIAANGHEVIDALKRQDYDLVLMDCHMPEMDGFEATRRIHREWTVEERPKIIALTADVMESHRKKCIEVGMDGFVGKPFKISEVVQEFQRLFSGKVNLEERTEGEYSQNDHTLVFDYSAFCEGLIGDEDLIPEMIEKFLSTYQESLGEIKQAIVENDAKAVHLAAHTFKGVVRNFYAKRSVKAAEALEECAERGDLSKVKQLFDELREEVALLKIKMENTLQYRAAA